MNRLLNYPRFFPVASLALAAGRLLAIRTAAIAGQTCFKASNSLLRMLVVAISLSLSSQAQDAFTNGLVAYYPFDGNANDVWGGLNGELVGNVTPTANRFGQAAMACNFDGTAFVNVPDDPAIHLQAMTISLWVQLDTTAQIVNLLNKDDWFQGYQLFVWDGQVIFSIGDGNWHSSEGNGHLTAGRWHHVAATYDGQVIRVYIDGLQTDYVAYVGTVTYGTQPLQIGRNGVFENQYVSGNFSNLRLYRRALSHEAVQQIYLEEPVRLPRLTLLASRDTVTLSWPVSTTDFLLEAVTSLPSGSWETITNTPTVSATERSVQLPLTGNARFFRLRKP